MAVTLKNSAAECPICLEDMSGRSSKALSCLHTFCKGCLFKLPTVADEIEKNFCPYCARDISSSRLSIKRNMHCAGCNKWVLPKIVALSRVHMSCPVCKQNTVLPPGGRNNLPVNFFITEISELQALKKTQNCQNCKSATGGFFCQDCPYFLCGRCREVHNTITQFHNHKVRALDVRNMCQVHQFAALYMCTRCNMRICTSCVLADEHQSHNECILDYSKWIGDKKNDIEGQISEIKPSFENMREDLEMVQTYDKNICDTLTLIDQTASEMINLISEQATAKKRKLEYLHQKNQEAMMTMESISTTYNGLVKSCETMPDGTNVATVKNAEKVVANLQRCIKGLPDFKDDSRFTFTPGSADLGKLEEVDNSDETRANTGIEKDNPL